MAGAVPCRWVSRPGCPEERFLRVFFSREGQPVLGFWTRSAEAATKFYSLSRARWAARELQRRREFFSEIVRSAELRKVG